MTMMTNNIDRESFDSVNPKEIFLRPSLNKKINEIYEISNKALRLAYNNAYQWLFDSFD